MLGSSLIKYQPMPVPHARDIVLRLILKETLMN